MLQEVIAGHNIDQNRIILTGLSMGGRGTWDLAMAKPEIFACIAPVCGTSDPARAFVIRNIPCWVFHGANDDIVPVYHSDAMVEALERAGADVKYTRYPEEDHYSWIPAYKTIDLYEWMLQQRRK
jgi:predicted peptidase